MDHSQHLPPGDRIASFGPFRLTASTRLLERGGEPVALGSRALDVLIALVERSGEIMSRRDLMERVWPDLVVEESNLRVHVSGLRKALGDGERGVRYIKNIPGRGYCFVGLVRWDDMVAALPHGAGEAPRALARAGLPRIAERVVGREGDVAELTSLLRAHRFVSIVGTGGLGKTTVAVSVGHALREEVGGAVHFVDLGALMDPELLPFAVATAVGVQVEPLDPVTSLLRLIAGRRLLLILDSCEHLIGRAAAVAERIYRELPDVLILTTSREALRVEGERIHLLPPLDTPAAGRGLTAHEAMAYPAVQLFMDRAAAGGYRADLTDEDAELVTDICRRLDGIALAIEVAAARVGAYGLRGTGDLLDDRFKLLWQGRRGAVPRHQTLQALLDWSFDLLSERDRKVLFRLSVFVGGFTLDGAGCIAADRELSGSDVADAIASLVDKSLVRTSSCDPLIQFRLLDTTRAGAAAKLAEMREVDRVAERHARYYLDILQREALDDAVLSCREINHLSPHLANIRSALEWSFCSRDDAALAPRLAARAAPLFLGLSLLTECYRWCAKGLSAPGDAARDTLDELSLQEGLAISAMFTLGNTEEVRATIQRGLALAGDLGDRRRQFYLLAGLHLFLTRIGDFAGSLAVAQHSAVIAEEIGAPDALAMADWMLGCGHHLVGDQALALHYCELGLSRPAGPTHPGFFGHDHRVRALVVFARALCLRGFPEQGADVARQAIDEAQQCDRAVTVCIALVLASTVSIWTGAYRQAEDRIRRLIEHAEKHDLHPYVAVGAALEGVIMVARGEDELGVIRLRQALADLGSERYCVLGSAFERALAEGLFRTGQTKEAGAVIAGALTLAEKAGGTYDMADLLRVKAEIVLAADGSLWAEADDLFTRARDIARQQSNLAAELRVAIAQARLWRDRERPDANAVLADTVSRYTEGFATPDLITAQELLRQLDPTV